MEAEFCFEETTVSASLRPHSTSLARATVSGLHEVPRCDPSSDLRNIPISATPQGGSRTNRAEGDLTLGRPLQIWTHLAQESSDDKNFRADPWICVCAEQVSSPGLTWRKQNKLQNTGEHGHNAAMSIVDATRVTLTMR